MLLLRAESSNYIDLCVVLYCMYPCGPKMFLSCVPKCTLFTQKKARVKYPQIHAKYYRIGFRLLRIHRRQTNSDKNDGSLNREMPASISISIYSNHINFVSIFALTLPNRACVCVCVYMIRERA